MTKRNVPTGEAGEVGFGLSPMSDADFRQIHLSTLEVLERSGVFVEDDEALDLYSDGGCAVDRDSHMVRIPPHVVEEAVAAAPERVVAHGRDPDKDVVLEAGRLKFMNFSEGLEFVDPHSGERRDSTNRDLADIVRLADYLSEMDVVGVAVGSRDVAHEAAAAIHNTEAQLLNTTKPVDAIPLNRKDVQDILEMAAVIAGGRDELRSRPIVFMGVCPVSPLKLPRETCEVTIECAREGIINNVLSMAMSGASSPVTLAGTLVVHNAEVLAAITLAQLTERGAPVLYGTSTTAMDLRLATASVGSPECGMIGACIAYMARRYCLPSFIAGA